VDRRTDLALQVDLEMCRQELLPDVQGRVEGEADRGALREATGLRRDASR